MKNGLTLASTRLSLIISIVIGCVFFFLNQFISKNVPQSADYVFLILAPLIFFLVYSQINSYVTNQLDLVQKNVNALKELNFDGIELPKNDDGFKQINSKLVDLSHHIEKIIASKNKAINENQNKSDYIAHMSHEIRIPLDGIIGIVQLLCMTDINKIQFNYLETIKASGDHLLALVKDILSYSKVKSDPIKPEFKAFYLHKAVQRSVDLFITQSKEKKLYLKTSIHENVPEIVMGDISKVRQILFNLISNAVKFTSSGGIVVSLKTGHDNSILILQFSVKDTGVGIPENKQKDLFVLKDGKGVVSGMGLKLTKQLIDQFGGKIEVNSTPNEGTEVRFEIKSKMPMQREIEILKEDELLYNGS